MLSYVNALDFAPSVCMIGLSGTTLSTEIDHARDLHTDADTIQRLDQQGTEKHLHVARTNDGR